MSDVERLMKRAEDACRPCGQCDSGLPMGCTCDPEPRAVIAGLLDLLQDRAAHDAEVAARTLREAPHCPTCTCGCTCGYGGLHEPENPRCELNLAAPHAREVKG